MKVKIDDLELDITKDDLWFISYIQQLKFGVLSEVKINNGKVVLIKRAEQTIKPL